MHRTLATLRLIVASLALALPILAAPAAQAQSVSGSASVIAGVYGAYPYQFSVDARTRKNGTVVGSLRITGSINESYRVESLTVTGNQATIWARAKSDHTLREFLFIDNGAGSVEPDYFGLYLWGTTDGLIPWPLTSGDVTVIP